MSWRELYPFQPRYFDLGDGLKMHYVDEGKGPPVVFVHGNPWWSFCYRDLLKDLAKDHRVVAFDHVGMGLSSKPSAKDYPFTCQRRLEDMERLLEYLKLGSVALVLHDWGGVIGSAWACRHPDRAERLVIFNTAAWVPDAHSLPWQLSLARSFLGDVLLRGLNLFVIGGVKGCFMRRAPSVDEREGYFFPSKDMNNRLAVLRFVQRIPRAPGDGDYDLCKWTGDNLHKLADKPTAIVWGGRDFVFNQPFFAEWKRRFPKAEVHELSDAGHLVFDDARDEVVPLVRAFIGK